jgi:GTP diphosphokinase / guanosine-3',5'-bis(diphosphate) 3'-diphosphatase
VPVVARQIDRDGFVPRREKLPKDERKRLRVEHAPHKSREAQLIKLADKISNVRAVTNSPAIDWPVQRRLDYIDWATQVVCRLTGRVAMA